MAYKILVVDDEKEVVEVISSRLQREGYETVVAFDGDEALEKVRESNPDVILLDLMMPKRDGFAVLKEIREKYNDRWRPVIIVSAKADLDSVKLCYNLEADHYLPKPCSIESIVSGVETMVSLIPQRVTRDPVGGSVA